LYNNNIEKAFKCDTVVYVDDTSLHTWGKKLQNPRKHANKELQKWRWGSY